MKPTLKDVARESNVSTATVSKVINKLGGYSKKTEERVLEVIKKLGYEPNAVARSLAMKSTRIIGVLIPNAETSVFAQLLDGIEMAARKRGYSIIICNTGNSGVRTLKYLKLLSENQVAGIIYSSSPLYDECFKFIVNRKIPCVLALTGSYKFQVPYVKVDDRQAAYAATKYLIENGHRKIALIVGNIMDPIAGRPRLEGYEQAFFDYNIDLNENLIVYAYDFSYKSGIKSMNELLDRKEKFTAVFGTSDDLAIGALNVAYEKGIKVPHDISIMGYDNTKMAHMVYPSLTTVGQPLYKMGREAAEKVIDIIDGKCVESTIMNYEIVEMSTVRSIK